MADSAEIVGDDFVVVHDHGTTTLSLAVPLDGLDAWLDMDVNMPWREFHNFMRDQVMPAATRDQVAAIEATDAPFALALVRGWGNALNDRLGKSLSLSPFGAESELLSPPTSGSVTDFEPIAPEPTVRPRRSRSTPKPS